MTFIRIIFGIALFIYGIYNIKAGINRDGERIVKINMFLAPVLLFICIAAYPPLFENKDYLTIAFVIVVGIFSGGGAIFNLLDLECLPSILHGVALIATSLLASGICPMLGISVVFIIEHVLSILLLPVFLISVFIALIAIALNG